MITAHTYPFDRVDRADKLVNAPVNPLDCADTKAPGDSLDRDMVNNPPHYDLGGLQVIDIRDMLLQRIENSGTLSYRQADYWSRSWEYMTRFMEKGGLEDLRKAKWYLDRLIESFHRPF